jgi:cytosine permease
MKGFEQFTGDYERAPVPDSATVNGWQLSIVKIGNVIALPAFMLGAELGAGMGLANAAVSMIVGGLILAVLAGLTGTVAARSRLTTSMITQFTFGRHGARIVNLVLAVTCIGWFGVVTSLFAQTLMGVLGELADIGSGRSLHIVLGGTLMTLTTIFGFAALRKLSNLMVPLLLAFLVMVNVSAMRADTIAGLLSYSGTGLSFGIGISAVVGGLIAAATLFPDICRFARSTPHALLAATNGFAIAVPVVLLMGTVPSIAAEHKDLFVIMTALGLGIPALIIITLASWATNATNLYSSSLGLAIVFTRIARWQLCIAAGVIGTALSMSGISDYFLPFLVLLGIAIPPIAGIYIADFFLICRQRYALEMLDARDAYCLPAFVAWLAASSLGWATANNVLTVSGIPALDSVVAGFLLYAFLMWSRRAVREAPDAQGARVESIMRE